MEGPTTDSGLPLEHMCVFREMLDRSPDAVVLFDETGRVVYCNAALVKMSGAADRDSVLPLLSRDFYANPDRDLPVVMERLRAEGAIKSLDIRVPESWLPVTWVELSVQSIRVGGSLHYIATMRDVSRRKRLQRERERTISVQQALNEMILEGSLEDLLRKACERLAGLYGADWAGIALVERDEHGEHLRYRHTFRVPSAIEEIRFGMDPRNSLTAYAAHRGHVVVRDYQEEADDGVPRVDAVRAMVRAIEAVALRDRRGQLVGVLSLFSASPGAFRGRVNEISLRMAGRDLANIIEAKQLEEEVRLAGITDSVTGLYNTRHFYRRLAEEMDRARRTGRPLTVMLFDCDNFKEYNDRAGHVAGDHLLRRIADLVNASLRTGSDAAFRYGGDEFVVLLPETDLDRARRVATRVLRQVRDAKVADISVSIGLAELRDEASPEELVRRADRAMYEAKAAGKDRVVVDRPRSRRPEG